MGVFLKRRHWEVALACTVEAGEVQSESWNQGGWSLSALLPDQCGTRQRALPGQFKLLLLHTLVKDRDPGSLTLQYAFRFWHGSLHSDWASICIKRLD